MRRFLPPLITILLLAAGILESGELLLQEGTPVWQNRELRGTDVIIIQKPVAVTTVEEWTDILQFSTVLRQVPIASFDLPGAGRCFASPDLAVRRDTLVPRIRIRPGFCFAAAFFLLAALAAFLYLRKEMSLPSPRRHLAAAAMILCVYYMFFSLFRSSCGAFWQLPQDAGSYFRMAQDICSGKISFDWDFTVGTPLLFVPFQFVRRAPDPLAFTMFFSWIESCVMMPLTLLAAYGLFFVLGGRRISRALMPLLLFCAFGFFHVFTYLTSDTGLCPMRHAVFMIPPAGSSFCLHQKIIFFGFNICSDTPAALFLMLTAAAAMFLKRPLIPAAALFGFTCLIRINAIFFAPFIGLLLILRSRTMLRGGLRGKLRFLFTGAAAFLLVFSPQFILNTCFFGSPFTFPYILHSDLSNKGFLLSRFIPGMDFLIGVNFVPVTVGAASLLFVRGRLRRTLLVLAAVPLTLFFCGYPVVMNCGLRWLLAVLPFLFFAPFACGFFQTEERKTAFLLALPLLFAVLFTSPCAPDNMRSILPWGLHTLPYGAEIARWLTVAAWVLTAFSLVFLAVQRRWRPFLFLLIFAVLFFSGMPLLTGAVLIPVLCRAVYDAFRFTASFLSEK